MTADYDDLIKRITSGDDVSREEMRSVHEALEHANETEQSTLWYIIELYDAYGYSRYGKATTTDPKLELLARAKLGLPISEADVEDVASQLDSQLASMEATGAIPGEAFTLLQIL